MEKIALFEKLQNVSSVFQNGLAFLGRIGKASFARVSRDLWLDIDISQPMSSMIITSWLGLWAIWSRIFFKLKFFFFFQTYELESILAWICLYVYRWKEDREWIAFFLFIVNGIVIICLIVRFQKKRICFFGCACCCCTCCCCRCCDRRSPWTWIRTTCCILTLVHDLRKYISLLSYADLMLSLLLPLSPYWVSILIPLSRYFLPTRKNTIVSCT